LRDRVGRGPRATRQQAAADNPAMPAYSFEALDKQGATRKGIVEADSARAARGMLRA